VSVSDLDALIASAGIPVQPDTLAQAWELTPTLEPTALPPGQILLVVTMRAKPGSEALLEKAASEFVDATSRIAGALGSSLHQLSDDPQTWHLIERFVNEDSFGAHMAGDHFRRFQVRQSSLLSEPVRAVFLQR
jgi:quinol monooxygenase YgiN